MSGTTVPLIITPAGLQPQTPASLNAQLIALVQAAVPGYTANLPGSLIEDLSSTATYALTLCDQALVELVNSLTTIGANPFILNMLGTQFGVVQGSANNTSVDVQFTGPAGYVVAPGFTVGDGTYQYIVQDGGVIPTGGVSLPLFAVATQTGSWPVGAGTVTQIATSVPTGITLAVTNPLAGTPGTATQAIEDYRAQVLLRQRASAQGMPSYLTSLLLAVPGVVARLVAVRQVTGGFEIIVGGGDPYAVADAIFRGVGDISRLVGSALLVEGISNANPGVVTTTLNHGYTTGQVVQITGVTGMAGGINGTFTITVLSPNTFSLGINTTGYGTYTGGGLVTPNFRNQVVNLSNPPDVYAITYVLPPSQTVNLTLTWNTSAVNFFNAAAANLLGTQALTTYINTLAVGQPMNIFEMEDVFKTAVAGLITAPLVTRLVFSVSINGIGVAPAAGTGVIQGDPESYFTAATVLVNQG